MNFKPGISRSLVLQKRKIQRTTRLTITGNVIPTINEEPVKSLGKWYDSSSTNDQAAIKGIGSNLDDWLRKIDKSGLPGTRILWLLLLHEVAITTVEVMKKISGFLRRSLGLPKSLSSAALYGITNAIQLPLNGLKEGFVVTRTKETLKMQRSQEQKLEFALEKCGARSGKYILRKRGFRRRL